MKREDLLPYVSYQVDNALNGRKATGEDVRPTDRLVGYQCGFEPLVVAVRSYLGSVRLTNEEAEELAADYLEEIGWFANGRTDANFVK